MQQNGEFMSKWTCTACRKAYSARGRTGCCEACGSLLKDESTDLLSSIKEVVTNPNFEQWKPVFDYSDENFSTIWQNRTIEDDILNGLTNPDIRILGLVGGGGIGKTATARHICSKLRRDNKFPDGIILYVYRSKSYVEAIADILARLEKASLIDGLTDAKKIAEKFCQIIYGKQLLFVIDNVDQDADANLGSFLLQCHEASISVLVTARTRVAEIPWHRLDNLGDEDALQLMCKYVQPGNELEKQQLDQFQRDWARGLPLAIRVLGKYIQTHPQYTIEEISAKFTNSGYLAEIATSEDSIKCCFDMSYDRFDEATRNITLVIAANWSKKISGSQLIKLCQSKFNYNSKDIDQKLGTLIKFGLIDIIRIEGNTNYVVDMHPILRECARSKVNTPELQRELMNFQLDDLKAGRPAPYELPADWDALRQALKLCKDNKWNEELHAWLKLYLIPMNRCGLTKAIEEWLTVGLKHDPSDFAKGNYEMHLCKAKSDQGKEAEALGHLKRAVTAFEKCERRDLIAWLKLWEAGGASTQGKRGAAFLFCLQALYMNLQEGKGDAMNALSGIERNLLGTGTAWTLPGLGPAMLKKLIKAVDHIQDLDLNKGLNNCTWANIHSQIGDNQSVVNSIKKSHELLDQHINSRSYYDLLTTKLNCAFELALSDEEFDELINRAEIFGNRLNDLHLKPILLIARSKRENSLSRHSAAHQFAQQALEHLNNDDISTWGLRLSAHIIESEALLALHDWDNAQRILNICDGLLDHSADPLIKAQVMLMQSVCEAGKGNSEHAKKKSREALGVLEACNANPRWRVFLENQLRSLSAFPGRIKSKIPDSWTLPEIIRLRDARNTINTENGMTMVLVPGDWYQMGPEFGETGIWLPPHYIDEHPVTNRMYATYCAENNVPFPAHWPDSGCPKEYLEHPVTNIDIKAARAYASWTGKRLPAWEEWLAAARGSKEQAFPWGEDWRNDLRPALATPSIAKMLVFDEHIAVDVKKFAKLLGNSFSLSIAEKKKVIDAGPTLSQFQVDELIKVFSEEKEKFKELKKLHSPDVEKLKKRNIGQEFFLAGYSPYPVLAAASDASHCGMRDCVGLIHELVLYRGQVLAAGIRAGMQPDPGGLNVHAKAPDQATASGRSIQDHSLGFRCVKDAWSVDD